MSFDKCVKRNGSTDFDQLPSLETCVHLGFSLLRQRYSFNPRNTDPSGGMANDLINQAGFNFGKFIVGRHFLDRTKKLSEQHYYWNLLYRDNTGKPCILRCDDHVQGTAVPGEDYQTYRFYTYYMHGLTRDPRKMTVEDLSDVNPC